MHVWCDLLPFAFASIWVSKQSALSLEHYLEDECFCPEPRNAAANFTALRLRAHHDLVHIPRLHALTRVAEKVGSLANKTYNPNPVANATYQCEVCLFFFTFRLS